MGLNPVYADIEPSRSQIDQIAEPIVVEFGAPWCGHCLAAQPLLASALATYPEVRHIRIEDGPGRRLGRSFTVKLWPTLIFLRQGSEVARLVRPADADAIAQQLARLLTETAT
jgi:thioredoxin 1